MKLLIILALLTLATGTFAQDGKPLTYEQRVERGFGQHRDPRFAGDKPEWMSREQKIYSDGAVQRGCPLCRKHEKMMIKKHKMNKFRHNRGFRNHHDVMRRH